MNYRVEGHSPNSLLDNDVNEGSNIYSSNSAITGIDFCDS